MQDVINKMIELDKQAQKLTKEAQALKDGIDIKIDAEKKEMRENYLEKAKNRIDIVADTEKNIADEKIKEIEESSVFQNANIEKQYLANKDKWVDLIYNNIFN
jgi:hypothetical protein